MMRYTEAFKSQDRDNYDKGLEKLEIDRDILYKKELSALSLSRSTSRTSSHRGWEILRRNTFHHLQGEVGHAMEEEVYDVWEASFTPQHGSLLPQQLSSPTVHTYSSMLQTFISLDELWWWTVNEQLMASVLWHTNAVFSLCVSAVALMFAPSWWDCWAKVCGDLSCFAMPYRNEQKKPAMGFHPFTKKRSVNLLPDHYIQYGRSLQFHKIPMLS